MATKTQRKPRVKSVTILGRRWFARTYGNTYHTAEIHVNGACVHKTPMEYGYGDQYLYAAMDWLEAAGYFKVERYPESGGREAPWQTAARLKFKLAYSVADVARERDL